MCPPLNLTMLPPPLNLTAYLPFKESGCLNYMEINQLLLNSLQLLQNYTPPIKLRGNPEYQSIMLEITPS